MRVDGDRLAGIAGAALVLVGYVAISRVVGEGYPFSPLSMFSRPTSISSRIVARRASGEVAELRDFVGWSCDGAIDFGPANAPACGRDAFHAENDALAEDWIVAHAGAGREPVEVVRRVFRVDRPGGAVTTTDCALLRCRAEAASR